jgi:hypothetical protein
MGKKQKTENLITPKSTEEGFITKIAKEQSKEKIASGEYFDPEYIKEHGQGAEADYQGIDTFYGQLNKDAFDKYADYIGEETLKGGQYDFNELNKMRAENQSNWEQAGNAIGRIATNILPQTVAGFASMLDIPGYFSAEEAANNSIVNWAMDAKKTVDEDWFPIYEESPGTSMNISDPAWWMSRGSGLVESIGSFLLQGAGMGKIVSGGLKAIGAATNSQKLASAIVGAERSKMAGQGLAGLTNAVALNQSEAVLEATQVFRDTYDEQLEKNGGDIAKAKQAASVAASTTMNLNKMNILLNLSSASAFITPLKYTRKLLDAPSLSKNLMHLGIEGGQEAAEELINHVASKAGMAKGRGEEYGIKNAFDDMGTMEGFEAAFLGAIGGIGQTGGTNLYNKTKYSGGRDENGNRVSVYETEKNRYDQQQKVIQELKDRGVNTTDVLKSYKDQLVFQDKLTKAHEKAKTTGDYSEVEALKTEMFENQAIKAFQSGTTQVLEDLYKAEAARPVEEVGQEYVDNANNAIKQLKQLEGIYNNFENYSNVDEIFYNRANKNRIERRANDIENAKKTTDLDLHKQVVELAKKYEFTNEQEVLFKKEGQVVGTEKRSSTSPLTYSLSDIQRNQGDTEQNQKVYDKFLAEVEKLPAYQKADQYNKQSEAINKTLIENEKEFQDITSEKHQEKVAQQKANAVKLEQLKKDLEGAKTKSQIENLKSATNDEAFRKAADAKIADIELNNVKTAKAKEIQVTIDNLNNKITNSTLEDIEDVRKEVDSAQLSQKDKQNLYDNLNIQAKKLNGEPVPEPGDEGGLSAFGFTATNPEEDGGVVVDTKKNEDDLKNNQANFETSIPSDYVNPDTEKKSIEEGVADAATSLLNTDKTMVVGEDENGNLVYNYSRSEEGFNRAAYLSREFNQTEEVSSVDREEFTNEIENAKVLDPDFLTPGTELVMEVDTEYSGEKYDPTSNTRETIAWNLRLEELQKMADEKGVPLNELDEYIDEVPIKVTTKDGETVFYVHDNAWYREENLDNTIEAIGLDKAKNHEIRKEIIKSGKVKSKVTYKSMGRLFKTYDNKSIPVSEAMPDGNLILAIGRSDSFEVDLNGATLLPSTPQNGRLYAVVPVGKDTYLPIPLERQPLTEESIDSIVFAIEGYLSQDRENPVVKAIRESSLGLDITELAQLGKYISQFVGLFSTEGTQGLEPFLINGGGKNSSLKANHPIIAVTATGIEFGRPGIENGSYIQNGKKVVRFTATIAANFKDKDAMYRNKETLDKKLRPMLKAMMSNADRRTLAMDGDAVIILNSQGETSTKKYTEFLKETHKTNILSVNTGTEENPKWAYTIQPTILFDTAFADLSKIKPAAVAKGVPKVVPTVTPPAPSTTKAPTAPAADSIEAKKADIERRRQEELISLLPQDKILKGNLDFSAAFNIGIPEFYQQMFDMVKEGKDTIAGVKESNAPLLQKLYNEGKLKDKKDVWLALNPKADKINAKYDAELAALEQQPTVTSDTNSVLQILNIPTNTVLEEGKNITMLDNGDIIPQNRKEGLAAAFGLIPVVESKATLSEEEYNNKVKEAKENAPILYQILGLPSQERTNLLSDVAAEVSAQVRLEEIEKLLIQTKSVEQTLNKITTVYRDGKISFPSPSQMQFLIAKAVELGLPIPPISTLYEESLKLLHRTELREDPYSNIYFTALGILRSRYTAFETLGKSEEELLEMGYPPLQNSYTLEQLQAFAKEELARIKKNNAADYAQWEKGGTSTSLTYKDYKALKDILASNILSLAENNRNLISRQMTERTESVQFIKDLEAAYAAGEVVTPKSIGTTTPETEVETLTGDALIEKHAEELLKSVGDSKEALEQLEENLEGLKNIKEAIASNEVSLDQILPDLQANGFESLEDAIASLQKAVELFNSRAENKDTFVLPDGTIVELDDNTQDANDIDDDTVDEMISPMDATQIDAVRTEVEDMIIRGLDPATQASLISYIASDIISRAMEAKDKGKKEGVKTAPIFAEHKKSLENLEKLYKSKNLVNKAARIRAVLDQFDKVNKLVEQRIRLLTTGTVQEDITLDDNEEAMGLEKVVYTDDWAFTVNSKSTASADLKKFFVGIRAVDENGKPLSNILGLPEIMSFDTVYNTLHELLANRPADYDHMIETLGLYQEKFPWIQAVVDKLEKAPEKIQNEFVSDMAKHHIDMKFLMWSKDRNGNYSLQRWSSNSSSIEQRLRNVWQSNLKGVGTQSNLVTLNENNEYVFNEDVVDSLIQQAQVFKQDPTKVTNEDLANWLGQFGIVITDDTYRDLRKGDFKNKGKKSWAQLFTNDAGLVFALAKQLGKQKFMLLDDAKILNDSVVKALAKLDALNNMNTFSNSFQAGGKTVYSYGNNNYLVNRMRDLTAYDYANKKFVNQKLIDDLKQISFTKDSLWLNDLTSEGTIGDMTRSTLDIGYLSLEALKKLFTESKDNRKLNNLSTAEHELTKIGFFQRVSGEIVKDHETGVSEQRRSVDFFYPTMSDKTTMLLISGLTRQLKLNAEGNISDENIKLLYKALVTPEINRIRSKQSKNIKGYEPNYFYFLPSLNTLEVEVDGQTRTFLDVVKDGNDSMNEYQVEKAVLDEIRSVFDGLLETKLADWKKLGIGQEVKDDKGKVIEKYSFMDKAYMTEVAKEGKGTNRVKYAAMDYVFNYLIANSEAYKLFAGDPALYAKFSENKTLQENLEETFVNIGKRLAGDIAPGIELANSANNKYYQVFFQDKKLNSNNVKDSIQKEFFEKVITNYAKNYSGIEGSDAQEYTTWQEHLYVMKQLGRITDAQYDTFKTKLEAQSEGIFKRSTQLTFDEMGIIMQPMKPVYVGNISSTEDNADRRVYIKSSSFPLIPELTRGLQIDKIRQSIEKFETEEGTKVTSDGNPAFVRASFGTANKVGAVANAVEVFDNDGNVLDNMEVKLENSLLLSRENFRIQQDVPYKRDKSEINIGTQERTLLFADLLDLKIDGEITGAELMEMYNKQYEELFAYANEKLSKRLGLIQTVTTESNIESLLIIPTGDMFTKAEELSEKLDKASPIEKVKLQQNFADEVGEDTLERVNFINKNFDKIVEQLAKAKMNFFFDETQKENEEFKKCD